jgi:hypothetical protein
MSAASDQKVSADLLDVIASLAGEEREILLLLARRLLLGQQSYARLDLAHDERDFRHELGLEVQDLLLYACFEELQCQIRTRKGNTR